MFSDFILDLPQTTPKSVFNPSHTHPTDTYYDTACQKSRTIQQ